MKRAFYYGRTLIPCSFIQERGCSYKYDNFSVLGPQKCDQSNTRCMFLINRQVLARSSILNYIMLGVPYNSLDRKSGRNLNNS